MRILFLGNSYTFYNDVPGQVEAHLRRAGWNATTFFRAEGGANLALHRRRLASERLVEKGAFDTLVLQDQSTRPLHHRNDFARDVEHFAAMVPSGKRLVLYQTWPRQLGHEVYRSAWSGGTPAEMVRRLAEAYSAACEMLLAKGHRARVAPVGEVWFDLYQRDESLPLYDEDGHHASPLGSAIAGMVLALTLAAGEEDGVVHVLEALKEPDSALPALGYKRGSEVLRDLAQAFDRTASRVESRGAVER